MVDIAMQGGWGGGGASEGKKKESYLVLWCLMAVSLTVGVETSPKLGEVAAA